MPKIKNDSILFADRLPLYLAVARNLNLNIISSFTLEILVFVDNIHMNKIEGFWDHMKSTIKKENGALRDYLGNWLIQYTFKRWHILYKNNEKVLMYT